MPVQEHEDEFLPNSHVAFVVWLWYHLVSLLQWLHLIRLDVNYHYTSYAVVYVYWRPIQKEYSIVKVILCWDNGRKKREKKTKMGIFQTVIKDLSLGKIFAKERALFTFGLSQIKIQSWIYINNQTMQT